MLEDGRASYVTGPGGLPLERIGEGGEVHYYHQDQLGSTRALTDGAGKVAASYSYDPYGNRASSTGAVENPFGYAGEYTDSESGLVYLRARYYDPATAQFMTRDPIGDLTRQPYAYAGDSPPNGPDPGGSSPLRRRRCRRRAPSRSQAEAALSGRAFRVGRRVVGKEASVRGSKRSS